LVATLSPSEKGLSLPDGALRIVARGVKEDIGPGLIEMPEVVTQIPGVPSDAI
jgi:hypothetical protein